MSESTPQPGHGATDGGDLTGSMVGRFHIRARLGAGGMGEVYRADDTKLKRLVALKRMSPQLRADEHYRRRFLQEAERASALTDAHIAGVYDVLEQDGEIFLVMEHVEGRTLRQRLAEPLSLEAFGSIATQCAEALVAAHEKDIIHRDIKPSNIMLTPGGQVKVLDFGVAKRLAHVGEAATAPTQETSTAGFSGTPAYMAPETLREEEADGRSDIFSLGIVFYEALTGRHPFRAPTFVATVSRILDETPPPPSRSNPRVPPELDRIVERMLAKRRADRYATAAELLLDLRAWQSGQPVTAPRLSLWRRRPLLSWVLAAAVMLVLATSLWLWLAPRAPAERVRVAVLPFANQTGDAHLDTYRLPLTQMLLLDLTDSPNIQVLPYERLLEITRGLQSQQEDISSPEAAQVVANYTNTRFVALPSMLVFGKTVRVQVEFRDARTGNVVGAAKVEHVLTGSVEDTLYSMLGELEKRIQEQFKAAGRGRHYEARPETARPNTVVAALHLNEGKNAFVRGDYAQALDAFQRVVDTDPQFALAYAWMGQVYGLLGYDQKASENAQKAADLITPQTPLTDAYFIEANLAERKYDFSAAAEKYRELIRLYPDEPVWRAALADVETKQGRYTAAISSNQDALRLDSSIIVAHQNLAALYTRARDLPQALAEAQKTLSLYKALGNREGEARALLRLSEIRRLEGDTATAWTRASDAKEIFTGLHNRFGVLEATKHLGDILFSEGKPAKARATYEKVLEASREPRNNRLVVQTLMNVGVTYSREGDLARATQFYERSLEQEKLYGEYKDWPALRERAQAMSNLAVILIEYGPDPDRGQRLARQALDIFERMGDARWQARTRMHLGIFDMNIGRYDQAVQSFQKAAQLFRGVGDNAGQGQATYDIGRCRFFQNRYPDALTALAQARTFFEGQDPFETAMTQILQGWTYVRVGDTGRARALVEQGLQAAQKQGYGELLPDAYAALGEVQRERGEASRARATLQKGAALGKEPIISESSIEARSTLGLVEAEEGNLARGLADCQAAATRARKLRHLHTLARAEINLARVFLLQKEYARAQQALQDVTADTARNLGLELRGLGFHFQAQALRGEGRTEEAQAALTRAREDIRQLQESLAADQRTGFAARRDIRPVLR